METKKKEVKNEKNMDNITQDEINKIHQAMAIEMMEEIMREMEKGERVYASINQDIILNLIEKIKEREQNYLYCHSGLKDASAEAIIKFTEQQKIIYKPIINSVNESCEFDTPLYKIGQCCGSWKARNGIIGKKSLFSSKNNFKDFKIDKGKDKSKYLYGSNVTLEEKDKVIKNTFEWQKNIIILE